MSKQTYWKAALVLEALALMVCAAGVNLAFGQDDKAKAGAAPKAEVKKAELPKPEADGFMTIFNGKDLTYWEGLEGVWKVKDGVIEGDQVAATSKHTFLILSASRAEPKKFHNFEFHVKFKWLSKGGNSGVQFRSKVINEKELTVGGYQADIDTGNQFTGMIYNEAGVAGKGKDRGFMATRGQKVKLDAEDKKTLETGKSAQELAKLIKKDDWNTYIIIANGPHMSTNINGELMADLIDESPQATKDGGVIALQMHRGNTQTIQFKDIKIKLLP